MELIYGAFNSLFLKEKQGKKGKEKRQDFFFEEQFFLQRRGLLEKKRGGGHDFSENKKLITEKSFRKRHKIFFKILITE